MESGLGALWSAHRGSIRYSCIDRTERAVHPCCSILFPSTGVAPCARRPVEILRPLHTVYIDAHLGALRRLT